MATDAITVWGQVERGNLLGQNSWEVKCIHCSHSFVANATKVKNHLLAGGGVKACDMCPEHVATALRKVDEEKQSPWP